MIPKRLNDPLKPREIALIIAPLLLIPAGVMVLRLRNAPAPPNPSAGAAMAPSKRLARSGFQSSGNIQAMTFSPDGRSLTTSDVIGRVRFWDVATGKLQKKLVRPRYPYGVKPARNPRVNQDTVRGLAYSRDGQLLGVTLDSAIWLFDGRSGKFIRALSEPIAPGELERQKKAMLGLQAMVSERRQQQAQKEVAKTGSASRAVPAPPSMLAPPRTRRATPSAMQTGQPAPMLSPAALAKSDKLFNDMQTRVLKGIVISPDGRTIASSAALSWPYNSREGKICIWDARTGRLKASLVANVPQADGIDISSDNRWLVVSSSIPGADAQTIVQLWNLSTRKMIWQVDSVIQGWDSDSLRVEKLFTVGRDPDFSPKGDRITLARNLRFSSDGKRIIPDSLGRVVLSAANGEMLRQQTQGQVNTEHANAEHTNADVAKVAPDAQMILAIGEGNRLGIRSAKDGRLVLAEPTNTDAFGASVDLLTISPDQKRLAYVDNTGAVQMWDISQLKVDFDEKKILSGPKRLWRQPKVVTPLGEE